MQRLAIFSFIVGFLLMAGSSSVEAQNAATADFRKYCASCHRAYGREASILQNRTRIYERIKWLETLQPTVGSMPPVGSFRNRLMNEPAGVRAKMLEMVRSEEEPENPGIEEKIKGLHFNGHKGFKIYRYAAIPSARSMAQSPSGVLFVGTGGFSNPDDKVYALVDGNGNQKIEANEIRIVAEGLDNPNGVAFRKGDLYVAERQQIRRFENVENWLKNNAVSSRMTGQVLPQRFPSGPGHMWKFIRFAPEPNDHFLYVPVGAAGNVHRERDGIAAIFRIDVRGSEPREVVAKGVRNTVGFDFHPETGNLFFTDNGRDRMGDDFPPDELNEMTVSGQHFGFPYCHGSPRADGRDRDPRFNQGRDCNTFKAPIAELDPHAAALGMRFYTGQMFPKKFKDQIFIAEHGSWNVSPGNSFNGYKVSLVTKKADGGYNYRPFISGWLEADGRTRWGRPVDVEVLPDGSMLISDDGIFGSENTGSIYRVVFE